MTTATGDTAPFYGKICTKLSVGSQNFNHPIFLADIKSDGIFGMDFFKSNQCRIDVEPNEQFSERSGLLIAKSLIDIENGDIPIRIANIDTRPCNVYKNTVVAFYEAVSPPNIVHVETVGTASSDKPSDIPDHLNDTFKKATEHLTKDQSEKVRKLLIKHQNIFSRDSGDIGRTHIVEHNIETGQARPVKQAPYRVPLAKRLAAEQEVSDMAKKGIIEPSVSPWSSPVVMVTKPNGNIRFCCDFRRLNECTVKDSQPLPRIDDTLDALSGSAWFSTLDCKSGFWQVGMSEKDKHKTAFSVQGFGLWQFTVMPFGLCNAPATFERLMERVLAGLTWKQCLVYLDDIIAYSKTFEDHLTSLDEIFGRMSEANLKLSPEKCVLFQKQVNFLGHVISSDGVATDPRKIEEVRNWRTPRKVREIRSFLGLCSYYRKFVKGFSSIAKPLHKLTEKGEHFIWSDSCENAFEQLKNALTHAPILSYPISEGIFILDTDASAVGVGSVLQQVQGAEEKVISYFSKCLSKEERRYCVTRRELLAVICSVKHYHHYLFGRHFIVRSDHGALKWLTNFKQPEGQVARWLETLSIYDFEIKHRAGRIHSNADALSRRPCCKDGCSYCDRAETRYAKFKDELNLDESCIKDSPRTLVEGTNKLLTYEVNVCQNSNLKRIDCCLSNGDGCLNDFGDASKRAKNISKATAADTEALRDNEVLDEINEGLHMQVIETHTDKNETSEELGSRNDIEMNGRKGILDETYGKAENNANICKNTLCFENIPVREAVATLNKNIIREKQNSDTVIRTVKHWVDTNEKPEWSDVAPSCIELKFYWNRIESLFIIDEVLYHRWESDDGITSDYLIVIPKTLVPDVLKELHNSPTGGHLRVRKTKFKVKQRLFWYGLTNDIKRWCKTCDVCVSQKHPQRKAKAALKQYNVGAPLERIALDIMGPLPRSDEGNKYVLTIVDYFTKWIVAIPIKNQEAVTVANKFIEKFVSVFGVPKQIHSDQGRNFESSLFQEMCKILGSEKTRTTAFRPQSDGLVERGQRTIKAMLTKFVDENQKNWDAYLPILCMAYNSAVQETTGFTPSMLMFGRELDLPIDLALERPSTLTSSNKTDYAIMLSEKLEAVHNLARKHISIASDSQKRIHDKRLKYWSYNEGDLVWLYNPQVKPGLSAKLSKRWAGPYVILKKINDVVYRIQLNKRSKPKVVHHDRLKRYEGTTDE
ncbi:uncharacterized protein LOC132723637 [Ruditapes philippinarum]|uniref:uncharacterized protein LOC132723637 n=1 Tax=Ruditapes philippinarum TaxID=129788 RepID=UPI00295ACA09|nr:uncharacterized protein LOC132723637 [Ruditapes philippinarum]